MVLCRMVNIVLIDIGSAGVSERAEAVHLHGVAEAFFDGFVGQFHLELLQELPFGLIRFKEQGSRDGDGGQTANNK